MSRWMWRIQQWARNLGWIGAAGGAMLLAAGLMHVYWISPAELSLAADKARIARARHRPPVTLLVTHPDPQQPLQLPSQADSTVLIKALAEKAQRHGVNLSGGQFSLSAVPNSGFVRLKGTFPVKVDYPAMRAFLADSLNTLPALVLDGFEFKRADIGQTEVDAQLQLSFYLRARP